jgi:hypothetical protein
VIKLRSLLSRKISIGWISTLWTLIGEAYVAYNSIVRWFVYGGVALNGAVLLFIGLGQLAGFLKLSYQL